jgi:short-subunit dehydrogenase
MLKPVALVTGASRGIGKAIALALAKASYDLIICARNTRNLNALKKEITSAFPNTIVTAFACDVSNINQIAELVAEVKKKYKAIDVLINNAGVFLPGLIHSEKPGTLEKLLNTNLYSAYHLSRAFLPAMIKRKQGHLVFISSVAGIQAYAQGGSYSISKFALQGLAKSLREELKPFNIRVSTLIPGATQTDSWAGTDLPASRFMQPEDVAAIVVQLLLLPQHTVIEEVIMRPLKGDI